MRTLATVHGTTLHLELRASRVGLREIFVCDTHNVGLDRRALLSARGPLPTHGGTGPDGESDEVPWETMIT